MNTLLRVLAMVIAAALAGCAGLAKKPAPNPKAKTTKAAVKTDPAAQKNAYDLGMRYYSQEKYEESRKAWQDVIRLGPSTGLGKKAQEYLRKTEQTLKTLREIEKQ
jgi:cytochrome c-type biogenesis protein CcmH/NrfG